MLMVRNSPVQTNVGRDKWAGSGHPGSPGHYNQFGCLGEHFAAYTPEKVREKIAHLGNILTPVNRCRDKMSGQNCPAGGTG